MRRINKGTLMLCGLLILLVAALAFGVVSYIYTAAPSILFGGNRSHIDTVYNYRYATVSLQTGEVVEGSVDSWMDYEDSDQLQVIIEGVPYLCHSSNCTLIGG